MGFSVDGVEWPVNCQIVQTIELKESELSGLMMDFHYYNDPLGKWMRYDLALVCPFGMESEYNALVSVLTAPVPAHSFQLPDGAGTIEVVGRVENLKRTRYDGPNGAYWAGTQFTVLANHPTAVMSLGELLTWGGAPMPDLDAGVLGDTWSYTSSGWVHGNYPDYSESYW